MPGPPPLILNEFYEHFNQLAGDDTYDNSDVNIRNDQDNVDNEVSSVLNGPITEEELVKNVNKLRTINPLHLT